MTWMAVLASYLLGSVPFAVLAGRWKGVDLRSQGSGNLGATNAIRVLGAAVGVPVLIADILKGVLSAAWISGLFGPADEMTRLACGAAAVVGHVFPVFLGFRGGKGVATAGGAFLALAPAATGVAMGMFVLVLLIGRYVSLASVMAAITLPITLWTTNASSVLRGAGVLIGLLVIVRHRANLNRLRQGTESRMSLGKKRGGS
ncbi:MAG: glycerol-3-phosphate acyltransferase [Gemmatimonadota bacterium]|nr:MAG: glycerol-3-phosphate acyltransferase [Gemmatimonadota bacterium]